MQIKDLMNDFEIDAAAMPRVDKDILKKLANKTVVVFGGELARLFCFALLYQNDRLGLNVKTTVVSASEKKNVYDKLADRDDFRFFDYNSVSEIKTADYVIFTGICGEEIKNTAQAADLTNKAKIAGELAARTGAQITAVSDSRIYGVGKPHRIYSENEYSEFNAGSPSALAGQAMRESEALLRRASQGSGCLLTVLRMGIILAASGKFQSPLDGVLADVAAGRDTTVPATKERHTFVYINDVIKAIVYAMTTLEKGEIYNVGGKNSTVSLLMICALLNELYGDRCEIEVGSFISVEDCALNSNKISFCGCAPDIDLAAMLELCVMSKTLGLKEYKIPYSHEGRLDSIHEIQLAFLLETDRICKKHNIKWFLGGGTLLGAIRHGGFIPWDDDADVMMLREDYDKFCKIVPTELPANMTFQSYKTDKACFYEFSKIRLNGTTFATSFSQNHRFMHNGVAFDIFCHDKTANSSFGRKIHMALTLFTRAIVFNKWNNRRAENGSKIQTVVTNFFKRITPLRCGIRFEQRIIKMFKNKKNAKYLYDGMGRNIYKGSFRAECLNDVIYVDFEGVKLPVPKLYDEYLTFLYGNYMELPPVSERVGCHEIALCDIGFYDGFKARSNKNEKFQKK